MKQSIADWVRLNLAFQNLNKAVEAKVGVSIVQFHLLTVLREFPGCSPQELAEEIGMHPSSITQSMKRMLHKEFIFVSENPRDSRKKILTLSAKGLAVIEERGRMIEEMLEREKNEQLQK